MGMAACFVAVDPDSLHKLQQSPALLEGFLYPDDGDSEPPNYIDVDKAWHGIHFMLTGTDYGGAEPLSLAVLGGKEIGDDVGYGPARVLEPAQVQAVAAALATISEQDFRSRFAPQAMEAADIYPAIIWVRDGQEALDYVATYYVELASFYAAAAARGDGAILWLC
ncbi:protein of unknown function [Andreprevotia lacus DSM 23236]|jgi:hypothetical protein|uniref:DUF1877 domain-containing protein n=1 Tax=Andreprevotia lacus DSM 23236 TaxID=1121001 RepID=A0A1W1XRI0_9NEIS|nr:YfbM family protein [Andreprevotia lacus]SMC26563.1 protein of unknown function [Andreprevotia lacus DSM 23236]